MKISSIINYIKNSTGIKYLFSSGVAFVINYVILVLLELWLSDAFLLGAEVAMVCAWIVSSVINFLINRYLVFNANGNIIAEASKYYALAFPVFLIKNFGILELLYRVLKLKMWIAAPIAEAVLFVSNYIIQKKLIFKNKGGSQLEQTERRKMAAGSKRR